MEKLHKYCLSVLLVIICSNVSAQISNGSVENDDCKQLYRLYHQILNQKHEFSEGFCINKRSIRNFAIGHKENAIDLIGSGFPEHQNICFKSKFGGDFVDNHQKHSLLLYNYEKNSKANLFAGILYFKAKVSKVRNKDYLHLS